MFASVSVIVFALLFVPRINSGYIGMSCREETSYTGWDSWWRKFPGDGTHVWFFSGVDSYHDNGREDRRYKFKYCTPSSSGDRKVINFDHYGWTNWDSAWSMQCATNHGIIYIESRHDNGREDRVFEFICAKLEGITFSDCAWTDYINGWDSVFEYNCPNNGVMQGIGSYHDNHREDRRFRFRCCRLKN